MRGDGFYWVVLQGNFAWGVVSQHCGRYFYVGREVKIDDIQTWGARLRAPSVTEEMEG